MREKSISAGTILHRALPLVGLAVFLVAAFSIHRAFKATNYQELRDAFLGESAGRLALAGALTALNYFVLTLYDALAFRYIKVAMPYRRLALTSFTGYALSNNVGYSFLSGGSIRYRMYMNWGVGAEQVAKLIAFCTATGWLGFATMGGLACLVEPEGALPAIFPARLHLVLGAGLLLGVVVYLGLSCTGRASFRIRNFEAALPPPKLTFMQTALGSLDLVIASAVVYALMDLDKPVGFFSFAGFFMIAITSGLVSQIPGGLGIFETIMLAFLSPYAPVPKILGGLLLFRCLYYFAPLAIAAALLSAYEAVQRRAMFQRFAAPFATLTPVLPEVFAFLTGLGGAILLFSSATPPEHGHIALLRDFIPLPMVETSHFMASLTGLVLLILARGLQRRVDAAYWATLALLFAGAALSLLKGLDYKETILLLAIMCALAPCRKEFYRKGSLIAQRLKGPWFAAIGIVLASMIWIGIFSHKHVDFSSELWWQFAFNGSAPRFLRAAAGVCALGMAFSLAQLFRPVPVENPKTAPARDSGIEDIVAAARNTSAHLALLGDKRFLVNEARSAFVMYDIAGRCAVAMGDPVGPETAKRDLLWEFRDYCERSGLMQVAYQVPPESLHHYADLGLLAAKFGEEAFINLREFTLDGAARKTERNLLNKLEREGIAFRIVPREEIPAMLPGLKTISDDWLKQKNTREKGFSLGFFQPDYLAHFNHAVLYRNGQPAAFANILEGAEKDELSVDLMRYTGALPGSAMEYLFLRLFLWGKDEGFQTFNFGMAPLSGIEKRQASPMWNRIATLVYEHGEAFYNFRGLRQYKEKFHPDWRPRYIAAPPGPGTLPIVLTSIATLVNRGMTGILVK